MPAALRIERDGVIARLTIDNPAKKNAIDPPLLAEIVRATVELPRDGVRAAVLTAEGAIFSAGFDLRALAADPSSARAVDSAVAAILGGDLPLVAALPGLAIGGGCELACACDLRVAHPGVALQMPPVRLGLVYPAAGLRRFVALIGTSRTRELFLTAARIPADTALAWGLVDRVVAPEAVMPTALELARAIADGAPGAVRATRRILAQLEPPLPPELEEAHARAVIEAANGPEAQEARLAFSEKRPPKF